jgi:hypothetical protein
MSPTCSNISRRSRRAKSDQYARKHYDGWTSGNRDIRRRQGSGRSAVGIGNAPTAPHQRGGDSQLSACPSPRQSGSPRFSCLAPCHFAHDEAQLYGAFAAGAVAYTCVRFAEAWGLWRRREWAQWLALLSSAMYLPWEFVELVEHSNWLYVSLFLTNVAILLYMLFIRTQEQEAPKGQATSLPHQPRVYSLHGLVGQAGSLPFKWLCAPGGANCLDLTGLPAGIVRGGHL